MLTQSERARKFQTLHERQDAFILPNPWDVGSASLLAHLKFEALATTSAGHAFSLGQSDGTIRRDAVMMHIADIASATALPVSADLENGFGDAPEIVAETIRLAVAAGVVGASIEDAPCGGSPYEIAHAVERIHAAAEVAHASTFPFVLTARAENYLVGHHDLGDTIARLQAYQEAGADVLYAPGLASKDEIVAVVRSVDRPVNVVMGLQGVQMSVTELSEIGVRRISVGSALARAAWGAFLRAAREIKERGTFSFAAEAASYRDISTMFASAG